ncbi:MAG: regulator [Microbacteriaceae bacterium]|nr:regulator [Microbacteriaceae bacterium]
MGRIALALPLDTEDRLSIDLVRHGHELVARCSAADELASTLLSTRAEFAVVAASSRYLNDRLMVEADAAGVRIVAMIASESDRRHAADLGLREIVALDAEWTEVEAVLLGGVVTTPAVGAARRGAVLAVWGPAGSPGRTTLAINLAAELAAAGYTVALADVDTHSGSVAPALGLLDEAPGFAAACRLAGAGSLDSVELERIGQRYLSSRGSFWVLTGIGRPNRWPELSAERVATTITACRDWVDYVVLDTAFSLENDEEISSDLFAPRRNAATIAALREADHVIAVGSADPVGLSRFLRAHVDLVETIVTSRVTVVMNKIRASAIGLGAAAQVKQTLRRFGGISSPVLVPHDQAALDAAILSGKTLLDVAAKSPVRMAIGQFVAERILPQPAPVAKRARRRRLETAVG